MYSDQTYEKHTLDRLSQFMLIIWAKLFILLLFCLLFLLLFNTCCRVIYFYIQISNSSYEWQLFWKCCFLLKALVYVFVVKLPTDKLLISSVLHKAHCFAHLEFFQIFSIKGLIIYSEPIIHCLLFAIFELNHFQVFCFTMTGPPLNTNCGQRKGDRAKERRERRRSTHYLCCTFHKKLHLKPLSSE